MDSSPPVLKTTLPRSSFDVIAEPLFTVDPGGEQLSLPALLARLLTADRAEIDGFPRVAAEQQGHWYRLLVRCAARALREGGATVAEASSDSADSLAPKLRDALAGLVPDGGWALHQPDLAKPGFLQVPVSGGDLASAGYKPNTLALLTGLLGEKYHERKNDVDRTLDAERTVYALVEYQTAAIYGGRGNYASQLTGSASGAGSGTPFVGAWIDGSHRATFRHDVGVVLDREDAVRRDLGLHGDVWALWTLPWDGDSTLTLEELDPTFIPLARRVRLGAPDADDRFGEVWFAASKAARVSDARAGNLGDPFIPVVPNPQAGKKGQPAHKARGTLSGDVRTGGYDYREVARLLFGEEAKPAPSVAALAERIGDAARLEVRFRGVAYAQGKTEGISHRILPLPAVGEGHAARLVSDDERARAAARASHAWMLHHVREFKGALSSSLRVYLHGLDEQNRIPRKKPGDDDLLSAAGGAFEHRVDWTGRFTVDEPDYFDHLFALTLAGDGVAAAPAAAHGGEAAARVAFGRWLEQIARDVFDETLPTLPVPTTRRLRREVEARDILDYLLSNCREETDAAADAAPEEDDDDE